MRLRSGSLFAGYGGLGMAVSEVFGAEPAWFSEIDDAPSKILAHHWPGVPNHGDITEIDWDTVEPVDILDGGFPCQDVSLAGKRGGMTPSTRSGLWTHFAYAISKLRPRFVVVENVRGLLSAEAYSDVEPCSWCLGDGPGEPALRALGAVLGDLAELGYDAQWCGLRAADVGAPHGRYRVFIVATDSRGETVGLRSGLRPIDQAGERRRRLDDDAAQAATYPDQARPQGSESAPGRDLSTWSPAADAAGHGRHEGRPEPARQLGRPDASERGAGAAAWGQYAGAIQRWERALGRTAPSPTEPTSKGAHRLSPRFVEWMMGLPAGHVTAVPGLTRNQQLKALGNGVVPQQAAAALQHMLASCAKERVA